MESELLRSFTASSVFVPRIDYGVCNLLRKCLGECEKLAANVQGVNEVMRNSLDIIKGASKNVIGLAVNVPLHFTMIDDEDGEFDFEEEYSHQENANSGKQGNSQESDKHLDALSYAVASSRTLHKKIWQKVKSRLLHTAVGRESK